MLAFTYMIINSSVEEIVVGVVEVSEAVLPEIRLPRIGETVSFAELDESIHGSQRIRQFGARAVVVDIVHSHSNGIRLSVFTRQSTKVYVDFFHERVRAYNEPRMDNSL